MARQKTELTTVGRLTVLGGFVAALTGVVAWLWTGEWRLAATGLAVLIVALFVVSYLEPGPPRP